MQDEEIFSRKSQLYGQIFIYVLTIVLVSFILVYGYNAIQNFRDRAEKVSCLKFKNDLSNAVKIISSDFGSVKRKDIDLCAGYTQVCFVETFDEFNRQNPQGNIIPIDPIVKDNILSNTGRNVFLIQDLAKDSFYIGNISIEPDVLCVKVLNNKISLRLEGKGDHASISQWS